MTEAITVSKKLSEMPVEQLVQVSQALGHQIEKLRADRAHIKALIDQKLAEEPVRRLEAELAEMKARVNGVAPGAVIEAGVQA